MKPWRRLLCLLVCGLATAGALAADAGAAGQTFTTRYYTIDVVPPSGTGLDLFLGGAPGGRTYLQKYFSGAPSEQWVPIVDPAWPGVSPVTGSSPITGIPSPCVNCGFSHATGAPRKFVNRLYGTCLTVAPDRLPHTFHAVLATCARTGAAVNNQLFEWVFSEADLAHGVPRTPTKLVQTPNGQSRCVDAANTLYAPIDVFPCLPTTSPIVWRQHFRFLEVASVTCTGTAPKVGVCGLPRG